MPELVRIYPGLRCGLGALSLWGRVRSQKRPLGSALGSSSLTGSDDTLFYFGAFIYPKKLFPLHPFAEVRKGSAFWICS